MSKIEVNEIAGRSGTTVNVASGHVLNAPGHVLQVKAVNHKGQISTTSTSHTALTDLAVTITPSATSSKMLITFNGFMYMSTYTRYMMMSIQRNVGGAGAADISGTTLYTDNNTDGLLRLYDADSHISYRNGGFQFLDSPNTTSSIVYNPTFRRGSDSATCYIGTSNMITTFSVMEIAA
jgi:hypothetical protein|tara:strand:- start:411 stop:947 length:537 start_codon:yes stop_codon:yes gene_type:complete